MVFYSVPDQGYICVCFDYPGVSTYGETPEDALDQCRFVIRMVEASASGYDLC